MANLDEIEPDQNQHFQTLLCEAQGGSEEAARELYETYVKYVLTCVRHKMWRRLRTRFDSQDFVQQVWASFFDEGNELPDFQTPNDLIAYLQAMAQRKVVMEGRRQRTLKGDVQIERRIDEQASTVERNPAGRDPTPSSMARYQEEYDRLVEQQEPEVRQVAELRAEGCTFAEIAESLEIDESTARRFMRRVRRRAVAAEPESEESMRAVARQAPATKGQRAATDETQMKHG